jgi:hypothetical protein
MGHYTGVQIDLRLGGNLPPQIATWLAKHCMGEGNIEDMNSMLTGRGTTGDFEDWKGGALRWVDGDPINGSYWHLKVNSSWKHDETKLAFFLHEIQPWLNMREGEVLARTIYEEQETWSYIFWADPTDTLIRKRKAQQFGYDAPTDKWSSAMARKEIPEYSTFHMKDWDADELAKPLGMESDYPQPFGMDMKTFNFPVNPTASPAQEEKRVLAKQHNENYAKDHLADIQKQLQEMEGK